MKEEDIFCHTFESNNTEEDMEKALLNPNTILICQDELFTGMEADAVVYCMHDASYGLSDNLRVNVMRATSKLNIICAYRKDSYNYVNFASTSLYPKFMNGCDKEMKENAFECLTCNHNSKCDDGTIDDNDKVVVCKSCLFACHSGHQIERKDTNDGLENSSFKCECKETNCFFLK